MRNQQLAKLIDEYLRNAVKEAEESAESYVKGNPKDNKYPFMVGYLKSRIEIFIEAVERD